jgi:hypothetical protein
MFGFQSLQSFVTGFIAGARGVGGEASSVGRLRVIKTLAVIIF